MPKKPIKVLHIFGTMNRGGAETWVMDMLRNMDRNQIHMDFVCLGNEEGVFAPEIKRLGGSVHLLPISGLKLPKFIFAFNEILKNGGYDVVHSHVLTFSGFILWLASIQNVPTRIAHIHTNQLPTAGRPESLFRRAYIYLMKILLNRSTTRLLACSKAAMTGILGEGWENNPKCEVLYYGIDLTRFHNLPDPEKIRSELGIPKGIHVIGHVGNFNLAKNHEFIISLAEPLNKLRNDICFLLIGDGDRRRFIEELVKKKGLTDKVLFTGSRPDVPQLLQAIDLFVLPSIREGLAIVLIEAQAAGLPIITSQLPAFKEVIFTSRHQALPFEVNLWVKASQHFLSNLQEKTISVRVSTKLERFSVGKCCHRLEELYSDSC